MLNSFCCLVKSFGSLSELFSPNGSSRPTDRLSPPIRDREREALLHLFSLINLLFKILISNPESVKETPLSPPAFLFFPSVPVLFFAHHSSSSKFFDFSSDGLNSISSTPLPILSEGGQKRARPSSSPEDPLAQGPSPTSFFPHSDRFTSSTSYSSSLNCPLLAESKRRRTGDVLFPLPNRGLANFTGHLCYFLCVLQLLFSLEDVCRNLCDVYESVRLPLAPL